MDAYTVSLYSVLCLCTYTLYIPQSNKSLTVHVCLLSTSLRTPVTMVIRLFMSHIISLCVSRLLPLLVPNYIGFHSAQLCPLVPDYAVPLE